MIDTRDLPMQTRAAMVGTADVEARTVELVWSTGAGVTRYDYYEGRRYREELSLDPQHVDLSRLNSGAPLLNTHGAYDLSDVIGVVERAWIDNGEARAIVRFSDRPDVEPIWRDVQNGIIRNVSVGYSVRKYEIEEADALPVYRAIDWAPMELSMVPIGADAGAGTRSKSPSNPCVMQRASAHTDRSDTMSDTHGADNTVQPVTPPDLSAVRQEAVQAERSRVKAIRDAVRAARLNDGVADDLVERGISVDEARAEVLNQLAAQSDATEVRGVRIEAGAQDARQTRNAAIESALLHRYNPGNAMSDAGREWRGLSLIEMARDVLADSGERVRGLSRMEIATRALSTSDFPAILANVANRTLRAAYEAAPRTFLPLARQASAADFKDINRTQFGDAPSLEKVTENGEFTYGKVGDSKETYALATYGKIVAITRQTLINDDLGAFTRLPEMFGRAAADLESDTVWAILTANLAMNDGKTLFHADHGNLAGTGAGISVASLGAARAAMRVQKGLGGRLINVQPRYLVVPAAKETEAQQFVASQNIVYSKGADVNPFAGSLVPVAEPRLDASSAIAWYLFADPAQIDTIEYAYLEGQQGVYLETRQGFDVDGMEIKARLDFAAKAIDWRGLFKNPGA